MEQLICKKCKAVAEDGVCPLCGSKRKLIPAKDSDNVYLTSCDYNWKSVVEDILDEAGITYFSHATLGSGVTVIIGEVRELYRYYVAFSDYERAFELVPDMSDGVMTEEELLEYIEAESENGFENEDEV